MGSATGRDLHVDQLMTQIAINYRPTGMIADMIAPIVSVAKETDSYPVFNRGEAFAIEKTLRARSAEANRITRSVSSSQYAVKNYALAYDVPVEDRANMDAAWALELDAGGVRYVTDKLMLDWDRRALALAVAGVGTSFLTGSSWIASGTGQGDPISMLWRAQEHVQNTTAQKPNSAVFGWRAWNFARRNTAFRNFVQGLNNGGSNVTREGIAGALELDRLLVAGAFYNPSNENQTATFSTTFPSDAVLLYYAPMAATREAPSFMYSFRWTSPELGTPMAAIRHEFDTRKRVSGVEVQYYQDEKVTGPEYGCMIVGVGSAQANGLT
jgi:hypothetical protein